MSAKNGIVVFLKIPGYQDLLIKSEPDIVALEILPIINSIENSIKNSLFDFLEKKADFFIFQENFLKEITSELECIVISDTVLITLPKESVKEKDLKLRWLVIIILLIELQGKMFDLGLLTSGAVNYGKIIIEKNCFAGRAIIEAYQLSESLLVSACVFSNRAEDAIITLYAKDKETDPVNDLIFKYIVPTKNGEKSFFVVRKK
jgi:hypothetical protein